ncbi:MAG: DUF2442 domain-containing protein [Chthoniobacterales bacterium]|nr:DUF2442 domain-containing protein [Chthoniobacterales bacterium]
MQRELSSLRLVEAVPVEGTTLRLCFADGANYVLDLGPDLRGLSGCLVEPLRQEDVFRQVRLEAGSLVFPTGLDYGGDVLRLWCEAGGVQDERTTSKLAGRLFRGVEYSAVDEKLAVAEE